MSEWRAQQIRLDLKGKDTLSSKAGEKGSWRHRNTKVEGLKLTKTTLSNTKEQETTAPTECKARAWVGGPVSLY